MDLYPWWTEEHKAFGAEIGAFVKKVMPIDAETRWKREFPQEIFKRIAEKGYTGAGVPKEYGDNPPLRIHTDRKYLIPYS